MSTKRFILLFLFSPLLLLGAIFSLNLLVDPFNITSVNLLDIKYKYARDDRTEKIERVKKIPYIQNLILGSSRSQHLDPQYMSGLYGGYSYNFGVGGGTTAEALGLLLYLRSKKKLPKNILLVLDLSSFGGDGYHPSFLKTPELNFLNKDVGSSNQLPKFLSIDAIRASFKTLKSHIKGRTPKSYFNENGLMVSLKEENKNNKDKKIKELAKKYYRLAYAEGKMEFSQTKIDYLKRIVGLCRQNNISLRVTLSPVYHYQFDLIQNNPEFIDKVNVFKTELVSITPYCDAMIDNKYTRDKNLFEDSVHYTQEYGDLYMQTLFNRVSSDICQER